MRISFVVPTRNSARTIEACVQSLCAQTHPDVEVVVVDNRSTDDTVARASARVRVETWGPERSAQRNRGTALTSGDVVVFVDSDMVLEPGLASAVAAAFAARPATGALVIPERAFGEGFLARCRALEKAIYVGDSSVEAPRAFRRSVIEGVGGWDESLTAAEDWDLADRVRAAGVGIGRVPSWIWHDEGRLRLRGTFAKKRYYGRWVAVYAARSAAAGERLRHGRLRRAAPGLLRHPVLATGLVTLKSVEAAGILAGMHDARREGLVA